MITRKRIYDLTEGFTLRRLEWLARYANPGRGVPLPAVVMVALPKSGSIFIQRALRRTLRVPIRHLSTGGMMGSSLELHGLERFEKGNIVLREHFQPRPFLVNTMAAFGIRKIVLHLRDPRAAIVSWTEHIDRSLDRRGLRYVSLSCERDVPQEYVRWNYDLKLRWQVDNVLPDFVRWIEQWLDIVETCKDASFLVTTYDDFARDNRAFIKRILAFYEIPYEEDWISIPVVRRGKNNIWNLPEGVAANASGSPANRTLPVPAWQKKMGDETLTVANAMVSDRLFERFGWRTVGEG
jgi:hypothetical protein